MLRQKLIDFPHVPVADNRTKRDKQQCWQNGKKHPHINPRAESRRLLRSSFTSHSTPIAKTTPEAAHAAITAVNEITLNISAKQTGPKTISNTPPYRNAWA